LLPVRAKQRFQARKCSNPKALHSSPLVRIRMLVPELVLRWPGLALRSQEPRRLALRL
jgi:hypothetical protein